MPNASKSARITGALIGLLIGDALGVPYEFHDASALPGADEIEFEPPAWFRRSHSSVSPGTWSDDGAQALILLNTLLECGEFDGAHFARGLIDWYERGMMAVDNRVFDVGIQTSKAISHLKRGIEPAQAGGSDEYSNGNGSLMRVLPLALWHTGSDSELARYAFAQSAVTHAHPRSKLCCALYCLWARRTLQEVENPFENAMQQLRDLIGENNRQREELEFHIRPDEIHYPTGSGYVVDSLFSARWACGNADYETTVKAAIKLGNDTDTTACIAGGIAGLKHGLNNIPERWRANLRGREIYQPLLQKLLERVA